MPNSISVGAIEAFIKRWNGVAGSERSNYQLFVIELCEALQLPRPEPAARVHSDNSYVFERHVKAFDADANAANRFIDCYRRGCFVLEAKSVQLNRDSQGAQIALKGAHGQAQNYARDLPIREGRPPFLIIVDVGNVIELYAEFSRTGGAYLPYPDPANHRIRVTQLSNVDVQERLRKVWLDPLSLDPTRVSARVTRAVASDLAALARSLEAAGYTPEDVGGFLTRCLFTVFAEDVGLLPKHDGRGTFTSLLESLKDSPEYFADMVGELWQKMDSGGFSTALRAKLVRFNGKFFKQPDALPLTRAQIELLLRAAHASWKQVEPAIFGTLLERALDARERHRLGAHYTPRSYVERLVLPTVIQPLREEWANVQAAALQLHKDGKRKDAILQIRSYHRKLCETKVLDPACGSGNFLYVTMEHMKRLEGEVLNLLQDFGVSASLETEGLTVDPHQFLGIEINPRAAAIAEMVLWIGYLQWHFRTRGQVLPPEPVLRDFHNIENRDAVLAWDDREPAKDEHGGELTRWDGVTKVPHPVTGESVPDASARTPVWCYTNPRQALWPEADYIIGNPPFIGTARMRESLGDGYTEALRKAWPEVPESADFVMYWWQRAAQLVNKDGRTHRFGLITTNSIRQPFNRRIVESNTTDGLSLGFAIPDHPWVENADGAAVRIAMTVGTSEKITGRLSIVQEEHDDGGEGLSVLLSEQRGVIHPDLRVGANLHSCTPLLANFELSNRGYQLFGAGFIVTHEEAEHLRAADTPHLQSHPLVHEYRNGRDLMDRPRDVMLIDAFGLNLEGLRSKFPAAYQRLYERVKPERDQNARASYRTNWWFFGEPRKRLREQVAGLDRFIATVETAKHRVFQFLDARVAPDNKLVCIALSDAYFLGVVSSAVHTTWALTVGSRLEDRPVYVKTTCFEQFPFPNASAKQQSRIRELAEALDQHRKRQQETHSKLTLTAMYNVLEKIRAGSALSDGEKRINEMGLISVLRSLHDDLDREVLTAYGWTDLIQLQQDDHSELRETLLDRLAALNAERQAEESRGQVRWLRPEFQSTSAVPGQQEIEAVADVSALGIGPAKTKQKRAWPADLPSQIAAIADVLATSPIPISEATLADAFSGKGAWKKRLPQLVDTLVALARAERTENGLVAKH